MCQIKALNIVVSSLYMLPICMFAPLTLTLTPPPPPPPSVFTTYVTVCYTTAVCSVLSCEDGAVRLVNGDEEYEGTLEICFQNIWTRICSSSYFDSTAAQVVCNQLGHPSIGVLCYNLF